MFHLFNSTPRLKKIQPSQDKQEVIKSEKSSQFLELLNSGDFNQAKNYFENNSSLIDKDKIASIYLEKLLKDPGDEDFKTLYNFIKSNIIDLNEFKNNRFVSIVLTNVIQRLEKDRNFNAISRLENIGLV